MPFLDEVCGKFWLLSRFTFLSANKLVRASESDLFLEEEVPGPDCTFWPLSFMFFPNQDPQASEFLFVEKVPEECPG